MEIRHPTLADIEALADIHVRGWQKGYAGIMPADFLAGLSVEDRIETWRRQVTNHTDEAPTFVADDGKPQGFIALGPEATDEPLDRGEVYSLYVDPDRWGEGIGSTLLDAACDSFSRTGRQEAILWTHRDANRTRRFYEFRQWVFDGTGRQVEIAGIAIPEVRYHRRV